MDIDLVWRRVRVGSFWFAGLLTLTGCAGYVPGRQAYWDAQVREMCARDGGVRIYDRLRISSENLPFMRTIDGKISVPSKASASPRAPAYSELRITYIRKEPSPQVWRAESIVTRTSDQAIIARWVSYTRAGGDFPSPAHDSHFTCPDLRAIAAEMQHLFIVEGEPK